MSIFSKEKLDRIEERREQDSERDQRRHSVLLVDDKDANIAVMAAILRPHFHLIEARDGAEALSVIEAMQDPAALACIVSDHRMPKMTGVALFGHTVQRLPRTRRILVTGYMDMDAIVDAINQCAVFRFIPKPFDAQQFLLATRLAVAAFEEEWRREAYDQALAAHLNSMAAADASTQAAHGLLLAARAQLAALQRELAATTAEDKA